MVRLGKVDAKINKQGWVGLLPLDSAILLSQGEKAAVNQPAVKDSKAKILQEFERIRSQKKILSKVATKEEEAEKEKNQEILAAVSNYTSDSIVKGLANLQLDFGNIINGLSEKLSTETAKLDELKRAIEIENQHLQGLQQVRVVADALHILTQEHQEKLRILEQNAATNQEVLEKEMAVHRKIWARSQQEFEAKTQEQAELIARDRQREAGDYNYEQERLQKIETDEYEEKKRLQERELRERNLELEKQWSERENFLADNQALLEENRKKVEGFEEELKQAYIKAKEEAIQEINREAKVKSDLLEKEWEGTKQGYELKIKSLEETIQRQTEQVADISAQLQAAMKQAQDLAMKAFASSGN